MLKKRVIFGLGAVGALVLSPGCGGSGSYTPSFSTGSLNFTGSAGTTETSTTSVTVPASGGTSIVLNGSTAVVPSGSVPAGTVIPAGTLYLVIPAGVGFPGVLPASSQLEINNNVASGIGISTSGMTQTAFALPLIGSSTSYEVGFLAGSYSTSRSITVGKLKFLGQLKKAGTGGQLQNFLPSFASGNLPNNGQNATGSSATAIFADTYGEFVGDVVHMDVIYNATFGLHQTDTVVAAGTHLVNNVKTPEDSVTFTDWNLDSQSVPTTGVQEVDITLVD